MRISIKTFNSRLRSNILVGLTTENIYNSIQSTALMVRSCNIEAGYWRPFIGHQVIQIHSFCYPCLLSTELNCLFSAWDEKVPLRKVCQAHAPLSIDTKIADSVLNSHNFVLFDIDDCEVHITQVDHVAAYREASVRSESRIIKLLLKWPWFMIEIIITLI